MILIRVEEWTVYRCRKSCVETGNIFWNFVPADRELPIFSKNGSEGPWEFPRRSDEEKNRVVTGSEAPDLSSEHHQGGNNILIYVSVLAAVVLGLLIYVAYKWWAAWWWAFTIMQKQYQSINLKDVGHWGHDRICIVPLSGWSLLSV